MAYSQTALINFFTDPNQQPTYVAPPASISAATVARILWKVTAARHQQTPRHEVQLADSFTSILPRL